SWIKRRLVVEGVAAGRRRIVQSVCAAKLSWSIRGRAAVLESGKLVGFWKGWFFQITCVGKLACGGRVIWPGTGVVEWAIAARIGCRVATRRIRRKDSAPVSRPVVTSPV